MITLEQAKVGMADKVDQEVVDEIRRSSQLLDMMVFDNAVSPGTGGSTLTYGYQKLETPSVAGARKINEEYVAGEATRKKMTADCEIMGGEFQLDRVIIGTSGAVDELQFQVDQKIKATSNYFHYQVINASIADGAEFDGLKKLLEGSTTEIEASIDLSTTDAMDKNYNSALDAITEFIGALADKPTALLMNSKMLTKVKNIARRAGYYSRTEDAFGRTVDNWDNIPLIDLKEYWDGSKSVDCVAIEEDGTSAIYAVVIAQDGFCGFSPTGSKVVQSYLPDLSQPGAVKKGDVELVAGVALKNTLKAGVLKGIQIASTTSKNSSTKSSKAVTE